MIRAYGKINGSVAAIERVTIHISAEGGGNVADQALMVKNPDNGYVFYEGLASGRVVVKIPLGMSYEINITEMDGYTPIAPISHMASEKKHIVNLVYEKIPPIVGYFVYTDGTWSDTYKGDKSCVGICFYVNGKDRRMVALNRPETGLIYNRCYWGDVAPDGILETDDPNIAITDIKGRENTDLILATKQTDNPIYNNATDYPAANFCNNYSYGNKGKGSWWLPACGELYQIQQNRDKINQNIKTAAGIAPKVREFFWSSTKHAPIKINTVWCLRLDFGSTTMYNINSFLTVLPVTNF